MNEETAKEILKESITKENNLHNFGLYMWWLHGEKEVELDGAYTTDELEVIVWWMKNKGE